MKAIRHFSLLIPLIFFGSVNIAFSQTPSPQSTASAADATPPSTAAPGTTPTPTPTPKRSFFKNVAHDQKSIWLSPFHVKREDLKWLVPLAATTAVLLATDRKTSAWVDRTGSLPTASRDVSLIGSTYVTGGVVAGFYLVGRATHNEHLQETGELAAEALLDTGIVTEVLKYSAGRMRPDDGSGQGLFFKHGSSFPSGHSSSAWSVATIVAYEYQDKPLIKYGAFAIATAVSLSRYSGRNHFMSDVLVGSSIGFLIGRFVFKQHH